MKMENRKSWPGRTEAWCSLRSSVFIRVHLWFRFLLRIGSEVE